MSINPEHVDNILSGKKLYEFRKIRCKRDIDSIVIYSTAPVMKVVAEVKVTALIEGTPSYVWGRTHDAAGIKKDFFDSYYSNKQKAVAYCLGKVKQFAKPRSLEHYGIKNAPQSFIYLD